MTTPCCGACHNAQNCTELQKVVALGHLGNLQRLSQLEINFTGCKQLKDISWLRPLCERQKIVDFTSLVTLHVYLGRTDIEDYSSLQAIGQLKHLKELEVITQRCKRTDVCWFESLGNLKELTHLSFQVMMTGAKFVHFESLRVIEQLMNLKYLDIDLGSSGSTSSLEPLAGVADLKDLEILHLKLGVCENLENLDTFENFDKMTF